MGTLSTDETTPRVRQTPMALVFDAVLALRLDVRALAEQIADQRAKLDTIVEQNAAILGALRDLTDGVLEQRARCMTQHPPPAERVDA